MVFSLGRDRISLGPCPNFREQRRDDGRFIAPTGAQVVELGPVNATIHKLNEEVLVEDLPRLAAIYKGVMERLLLG